MKVKTIVFSLAVCLLSMVYGYAHSGVNNSNVAVLSASHTLDEKSAAKVLEDLDSDLLHMPEVTFSEKISIAFHMLYFKAEMLGMDVKDLCLGLFQYIKNNKVAVTVVVSSLLLIMVGATYYSKYCSSQHSV